MTNIQSIISSSLQVASIIPGKDIVGVFDDNFNQLFQQARPVKLRVFPNSKLMRHPIETGTKITDHQIFEPVEIELDLILNGGGILSLINGGQFFSNYQSLYNQINTYYKNGSLLTIQTKVGTYPNMVIEKMPHEETPEMFDAVLVKVKFSEALIVQAQYATLPPKSVVDPTNASTQQIGEQQTFAATDAQITQAGFDVGNLKSSLNLTGVGVNF